MAPRKALENIQYNILAAAESGLPPSNVVLQPPSTGKAPKRSRSRLTTCSLKPWAILSLLVLSLTIFSKSFGYMLRNNDQKAAELVINILEENEPQVMVLEKKRSNVVNTAIAGGGGEGHSQVTLAKKNERSTLEEAQSIIEEDKLVLHAIQELKRRPWPKMLPPIQVLPSSPDACAEATHTPKVAILFLTRGNLFHEPSWKEWFRSAAGVLPAENAALQNTDAGRNLCSSNNSNINSIHDTDIIASQHLFNVYIHAPPSFNESELSPLWKNHMIQNRLNPTWGSADLVQATRFLLWEAFRDPSNQRFILLSESDLPLFHPLVLYQQIMGEEKSRTNAWPRHFSQLDTWRWTWRMAMPPHNILQSLWRKSGQFFSLIRSHAELVLRDNDVFRGFQEYCKSGWDDDYKRWRDCYSDEHYIPTLLAMHRRENETLQEVGSVTFADWTQGGAHPRDYTKDDVSVDLFGGKLGIDEACLTPNLDRNILLEEVEKTFIRIDEMENLGNDVDSCKEEEGEDGCVEKQRARVEFLRGFLSLQAQAPPLKSTCFVTTRKFGPGTVDSMLDDVFLQCDNNGLSLLNKDVCERAVAGRIEQQRWAALAAMERAS
ncbi:hypothetical protein Ndes2437B_g08879 [Nannochloris sp. 'desiccata']